MDARLSERDLAEVERSAEVARKVVFTPQENAQIARYLDPPESSPFPLEYAFHLLGDVRGKTVLDLGCGSGESVIPLIRRGANVIAMDISPELIALARTRLDSTGMKAVLQVGSAYETGLGDGSIDVIFCMSLIHHLDIAKVRNEMLRVLAPHGYIVLKEPIRFSKSYAKVRNLLPAHNHISDFEHPLSREELATMTEPFTVESLRYFRLPIVPLALRWFPAASKTAWKLSAWVLRNWPAANSYATSVTMKLRRQSSV
ncbi:MAG: class I SAM-dependent methyltransferase [Terriglobales bacterium]